MNQNSLLDLTIKPDKELIINNNIYDEVNDEVTSYITNNKRVFIEANPGLGKTYYFAKIGNQIKNNSTSFKRLIFCTPRLIIQDQIKNELNVDFELNGTSTLSNLKESSKIITSTFKSLYKISDSITKEDLIVIDEAHELLRNYNDSDQYSTKEYYQTIFKVLYNTEASIVLMSGTPVDSFHKILGLKHLTIRKKLEDITTINIAFNKFSKKHIAIHYAEKYLVSHNENSLNIIYVKSIKYCEQIALYLQSKGHNSKVLTSETKDSNVYLKITSDSIIPIGIKFIITTNVIAVGTNILNKNIGGVLMIDEYNPMEIKQFVKRFRRMNNLNVDLVNKVFKNSEERLSLYHRRKLINQKNNNVNNTLGNIQLLKTLKPIEGLPNRNNGFGDINHHIDIALTTFFIAESSIGDSIVKTYNTTNLLIKAINQYDDLKANDSNFNYDVYDSLKDVDSETKTLFKKSIDNKINEFIDDIGNYLLWVGTIIEHTDYDRKLIFEKYLKDRQTLSFTTQIQKDVKNPLFIKYIINPLLDYIAYFNDAELCLKFIQKIEPNHRNRHLLSLYINNLISTYFIDGQMINQFSYKDNTDILLSVNRNKKIILDIVNFIRIKIDDKNYFRLSLLKTDLLKSGLLTQIDRTIFPGSMLNKKNEVNTHFILGIIEGIYILKKSQLKRKDSKGINRKVYVFESDTSKYPKNLTSIKKRYDKKTKVFTMDTYIKSSKESINSCIT